MSDKVSMEMLLEESRLVEAEAFRKYPRGIAVHKEKEIQVLIRGIARDEETLALSIVYVEEGHAWLRPLHVFLEKYRPLKEES